jgi:hypothetical protein
MDYLNYTKSADLKLEISFFSQTQIGEMDEQEYQNLASLHPDERSFQVSDEIIADEVVYSDHHPTGVWFDPLLNKFYEVRAFEE